MFFHRRKKKSGKKEMTPSTTYPKRGGELRSRRGKAKGKTGSKEKNDYYLHGETENPFSWKELVSVRKRTFRKRNYS